MTSVAPKPAGRKQSHATRVKAKEPPPSHEVESEINRVEQNTDHGMDLETWAEWLRILLPGPRHGYALSRKPAEATHALPGTPEKEAVLRRRALRGEDLHHPDDPKYLPSCESGEDYSREV
jgi:hypothetical protein